jgi:hypothetical protein
MQAAAKVTGMQDPPDVAAIMLLEAAERGRFVGKDRLDVWEREQAALCANNLLASRCWDLERHHLNGDSSDNSRTNLLILFKPTHQIIGRTWIRSFMVQSIWHERLRRLGYDLPIWASGKPH